MTHILFLQRACVIYLAFNHTPLYYEKHYCSQCSLAVCVHGLLQVNVFLSRLCGEPIGFTVLGIFVIDKNTVLTVSHSR